MRPAGLVQVGWDYNIEKRTISVKEKTSMSDVKSDSNIGDDTSAPIRLPDPPAGMMRVTKTELVWPGKYNDDGTLNEVPRVSLPFQVIETVNESRATREVVKNKGASLFDTYEGNEGDTFEAGWRNKLIWGDNLLVMGSLLEKFAGKIDLIYIDPPFATGADFSFKAEIGEEGEEIFKEQSVIEEKAYRDTWGRGLSSYLNVIMPRLRILHDLLSEHGSMIVHCDFRVNSHIRLIMDDIFGPGAYTNEIIWNYATGGASNEFFACKHDTLLFYRKGSKYKFFPDRVREQRTEKAMLRAQNPTGARISSDDSTKLPTDVWQIAALNPMAVERLNYPTQKPEELIVKALLAASDPGDLILDAFCGSGTTLAASEKLGRRWIGCDLGRWATHVTRKRLLGIENCKPFEVLNLGRYERQYWQGVTFGESRDKPLAEQALYEYLAFILKLYGAQPVAGLSFLHGKKGKAMVHIGAVDAPVTISEIDAALDECARLRQSELHILGWEWEMGLYDLMVEAAKKKGVKLLLLIIPREVMEQQAAAKGDVRFFELAYLEADISQPKKLTAKVTLKDFVISNTDLIPEEVRSKVKKWSDYIDYWSVDWDFRNDTFMQGWVAYRTRKERSLPLACDAHTYEKAGKYRILVKVIDIFGNDTSQAFDVEVR
jgi:DNA modification methylase